MTTSTPTETVNRPSTFSWRARGALLVLMAAAIAIVFVTNRLLTDRFTENTRNRAELRLVLYSGNLLSGACARTRSCRSFWRATRR